MAYASRRGSAPAISTPEGRRWMTCAPPISAGWLGGLVAPEFDHFDVVAPEGGYITGFYFTQFENVGTIVLAMDNLDYIPIPETVGLPTFVLTICGMLFVHRRMKAVRRYLFALRSFADFPSAVPSR